MTQSSKLFKGQVKYTGLTTGSIKWKSGHLLLAKDDRGWKLDLVLAVTQNGRPALSVRVSVISIELLVINNKCRTIFV